MAISFCCCLFFSFQYFLIFNQCYFLLPLLTIFYFYFGVGCRSLKSFSKYACIITLYQVDSINMCCHLIKYLNRTSAWFRSDHNGKPKIYTLPLAVVAAVVCCDSVYHVRNQSYGILFILKSAVDFFNEFTFIHAHAHNSFSSSVFLLIFFFCVVHSLVGIRNVLMMCCSAYCLLSIILHTHAHMHKHIFI